MISRPFGQNSNTFSSVKPSNFSRKIKYPLETFWLLKKILLLSVLWFSAASVNAPTIPLILEALLPSRGFDIYGPGARFSKVPIINGPGKLSPFTLKIEVSIVLHTTQ